MSDVRELLARLNPTTVRYDVGRGGVPELTSQDIAAALGRVPAGLGREVLEACWWPDGAVRRPNGLRDAVYAHVLPEIERQGRELSDARTHRGLLHACAAWARGSNDQLRRELVAAEAHVEAVKLRCWPSSAWEMLPVIVRAVINEIARPEICPCCDGRRCIVSGELVVKCEACRGRGRQQISDRSRAAAIGRDESTFRAKWRPMYIWLLDELAAAETEAAWALGGALRRAG